MGRLVAAGLSWAGTAQAATAIDYYLKIDSIKGESTNEKHKDWSALQSFSWGVVNAGSGGGGGASVSKPIFSDFSWAQMLDSSVVPIMLGVAGSKHFKDATFEAVYAGSKKNNKAFFTMKFEDVLLKSLKLDGDSAGIGFTASLNTAKIEMTYRPLDQKGGFGNEIVGAWNLKETSSRAFVGDPQVLYGLALARPTSFDVAGLPTVPVPEPQTWVLFGLGLAGLMLVRLRPPAAF